MTYMAKNILTLRHLQISPLTVDVNYMQSGGR